MIKEIKIVAIQEAQIKVKEALPTSFILVINGVIQHENIDYRWEYYSSSKLSIITVKKPINILADNVTIYA